MNKDSQNSNWILHAKTAWGAQHFPFINLPVEKSYPCEQRLSLLSKIEQMLCIGCSGLLTGPNGNGKSHLIWQLSQKLQSTGAHVILHSHTTLRSNSLIRCLCRELGVGITSRKEDNIHAIHSYCDQQQPMPVILIFDEASNMAQETLEEIRLLKCYIHPEQETMHTIPILLCGDENLYPRLSMRYFKPLLSRMSFIKDIPAFTEEEVKEYITYHLNQAKIHSKIFDTACINTIYNASKGNPRTINTLCTQSIGIACENKQKKVTPKIIEETIEQMPWIHLLHN